MPEEKKELTEEEVKREQIRAQYFDLLTVVNMFIKQGNAHGYFNRPDEVEKFQELRKVMAERGTPIPDINRERTVSMTVTFEMPLTDEMLDMWGRVESGTNIELNYEQFETWWRENVGRDKAKFAKFMKEYTPKPERVTGGNTRVISKTTLGEWPDGEIEKIGREVLAEIKNSSEGTRTTMEVF